MVHLFPRAVVIRPFFLRSVHVKDIFVHIRTRNLKPSQMESRQTVPCEEKSSSEPAKEGDAPPLEFTRRREGKGTVDAPSPFSHSEAAVPACPHCPALAPRDCRREPPLPLLSPLSSGESLSPSCACVWILTALRGLSGAELCRLAAWGRAGSGAPLGRPGSAFLRGV